MNSRKETELDVGFEVVVLLGQILVPSLVLYTLRIKSTVQGGERTAIKSCLECRLGRPDAVLHHRARWNGVDDRRQGNKNYTAECHLSVSMKLHVSSAHSRLIIKLTIIVEHLPGRAVSLQAGYVVAEHSGPVNSTAKFVAGLGKYPDGLLKHNNYSKFYY